MQEAIKQLSTIFEFSGLSNIQSIINILPSSHLEITSGDFLQQLLQKCVQFLSSSQSHVSLHSQTVIKSFILALLQFVIASKQKNEFQVEKFFSDMMSITNNEPTFLPAVFCFLNTYSYLPDLVEQKIYQIQKFIVKNRNCKLLVDKLYFQILNSTFKINKTKHIRTFHAQKCVKFSETYYLHKQYGKLEMQEEQNMLKLSILINALNWTHDFAEHSSAIMLQIGKSVFLDCKQKTFSLFLQLQKIAINIFQKEQLYALRNPFYNDIRRLIQILEKIKLFENVQESYMFEVVIINISYIIMIPISLRRSDHLQNYENILQSRIQLLKIQGRQQLVLPLISQQLIKAQIFSNNSNASQFCLQLYEKNDNQNSFVHEQILLSFIHNYFNEQSILWRQNLQFCYYNLQFKMGLKIEWWKRMKWCLYFLYLAKRLSKSNEKGLNVLAQLLQYTINEKYLIPENTIINNFVINELKQTPSRARSIIISILIQNIKPISFQLSNYLLYKYQNDITAKAHFLQSIINRMYSLSFRFFDKNISKATQIVRNNINQKMKWSDLDNLWSKMVIFIGNFDGLGNPFFQSLNTNVLYNFQLFKSQIFGQIKGNGLQIWNNQSLSNSFDSNYNKMNSYFNLSVDYENTRKKFRRSLSELIINTFKRSVFIRYCYISLQTHMSPKMQQEIFQNCQTKSLSNFIKSIVTLNEIKQEALACHYTLTI